MNHSAGFMFIYRSKPKNNIFENFYVYSTKTKHDKWTKYRILLGAKDNFFARSYHLLNYYTFNVGVWFVPLCILYYSVECHPNLFIVCKPNFDPCCIRFMDDIRGRDFHYDRIADTVG